MSTRNNDNVQETVYEITERIATKKMMNSFFGVCVPYTDPFTGMLVGLHGPTGTPGDPGRFLLSMCDKCDRAGNCCRNRFKIGTDLMLLPYSFDSYRCEEYRLADRILTNFRYYVIKGCNYVTSYAFGREPIPGETSSIFRVARVTEMMNTIRKGLEKYSGKSFWHK